jgi:phosphopantothenoylcysteine synthetase/decarboxylase
VSKGEHQQHRVLYIISCGSPVAQHVPELVIQAQAIHWDICVLTTPHGRSFLDISSLESLTGYPVRSMYKHPDEPDILPQADALITFPATFNTLNKWALGITDTLAVGLLCEYTGLKKPIIAVPVTGEGLGNHPALLRSVRMLRRYGVQVLYEPEVPFLQQKDPIAMILQALEERVQRTCRMEH